MIIGGPLVPRAHSGCESCTVDTDLVAAGVRIRPQHRYPATSTLFRYLASCSEVTTRRRSSLRWGSFPVPNRWYTWLREQPSLAATSATESAREVRCGPGSCLSSRWISCSAGTKYLSTTARGLLTGPAWSCRSRGARCHEVPRSTGRLPRGRSAAGHPRGTKWAAPCPLLATCESFLVPPRGPGRAHPLR